MNANTKLKHDFFKIIDSEEKAYFLGLLYADGYNYTKGKSKFVSLRLMEKDKDILEKFNLCIGNPYNLSFYKKRQQQHSNVIGLQINSKTFCDYLEKMGCPQTKTSILKFPKEKQVPSHLVSHFIRGCFDGDGSVWEGKRYRAVVKDNTRKGNKRERIIHNVKFNITGTISMMKGIQSVLISKLGFKKNKLNISKNINNFFQI